MVTVIIYFEDVDVNTHVGGMMVDRNWSASSMGSGDACFAANERRGSGICGRLGGSTTC